MDESHVPRKKVECLKDTCVYTLVQATPLMNSATTNSSSATCQPRERNAAVVGIAVAFLLALMVCLAAWEQLGGGGGIGGKTPGTIAGNTPGSGGGDGTAHSGTGPGAGVDGTGRGRDGTGEGNPLPAGLPQGESVQVTSDAESSFAAPPVQPPVIGFTLPDEPEPPPVTTPPKPVAPSGVPDGNGTPGRSGKGNGGPGEGGTEFMGVRTSASRVIYVIDFSGSMHQDDRLIHTKLELRRSIEKLPEAGAYSIIFFASSPLPMPPGKMVVASKKNKQDGIDWMRQQQGGGGTDPTEAMELALQDPKPDTIYLMTDGVFAAPPVFEVIDRLNADRKVVINTIAFHERTAEDVLKRIAAENHGDYTYIPPPKKAP